MPRELRPFVVIVIALVLASITLDMLNGRFWVSDLRVYLGAAAALLQTSPVYGVAFGEDTGFFKYAPIVAMAFAPSAALPFTLVAILHLLLEGLALIWCVVALERLLMRHVFGTYMRPIVARSLLLLLCIGVLFVRELHLGNVNSLLLLLAVQGTARLAEGNDARSGFCFGLLWLVKPYLAFMAVPLLAHGRWKALLLALCTMTAGLLLPFIVLGPSRSWELHRQWLLAMGAHGTYLSSPDTLPSLLHKHVGLHLSGLLATTLIILGAGLALGVASLLNSNRSRADMFPGRRTIVDVWAAQAMVPLLVVTDEEHFLFATPLIVYCLALIFQGRHLLGTVVFGIAMALFSTRSSDLLGSGLYASSGQVGALGLGCILLICVSLALRPAPSR